MKKIMFVVVILILTTTVHAQEKSYSIMLEYDSEELFLLRLRLVDQETPRLKTQLEEGYLLETTAYDGSILHKQRFTIPLEVFVDVFDEEGNPVTPEASEQTLQETTITLLTPYYKEATAIRVYDPQGELKLTIDVSTYADYCGDKKCSKTEDSKKCPNDCIKTMTTIIPTTTLPPGPVCGDGVCEPAETQETCPKDCGGEADIPTYIIMVLVILAVMGVVYLLTRKKS